MDTEGEPADSAGGVGAVAGPWSLVVPLKRLALAKSRLAGAFGPAERRRLALAFAQDTVAAALACEAVRDVVVVTDDRVAALSLGSLGARTVPDRPAAGLNAALVYGAEAVRARRPGAAVATLNADLPALRPAELGRVLAAAGRFPRAFLADAADIGTTFLSAAPGIELCPGFGGPSRRRHLLSGAAEIRLGDVASVRRDVDTAEDLRAALALGVGPRTAERRGCPLLGRSRGLGGGRDAGTAG
ncbi:2-phospho-L-lactate guanylyltransferase [Streptomyces sp. TRM49041]|uniref:2-phospho-L-lactate guanylyltransferase n=1 Tax=Streptomyces sp. TRM49041 TaxID=2603216 RepID=UPI0011ECB920|nr:2-phospho-L-lactate guanylyltransferase [Streptomyces sp. TRM49041]